MRLSHNRCCQTCKAEVWLSLYVRALLLPCIFVAPVAAEAAPQPASKWQVTSPAGEESLTLSLKAEKPVTGWMKTSVPTLTIQCSKGKAALYIETGMALEVTMIDQQVVHIQLDDNKPIPQRWREVTNATVSATARDAMALIKQFTQSQKFIFEFIPFNVASVQAEFAVVGLSTYLPQLSRTCWGK